jgi:hypothetical protein
MLANVYIPLPLHSFGPSLVLLASSSWNQSFQCCILVFVVDIATKFIRLSQEEVKAEMPQNKLKNKCTEIIDIGWNLSIFVSSMVYNELKWKEIKNDT